MKVIIAIKTDQPEAYIALCQDGQVLYEESWLAHKELSSSLLMKIENALKQVKANWKSISGVVAHSGPGSFTGLRIGATVANTIAQSNNVPIVGSSGDNWLLDGLLQLDKGVNDQIIQIEYGGEANTTKPRK